MTPVDAKALAAAGAAVDSATWLTGDEATHAAAEAIEAYLDARRPAGDVRIEPGAAVLIDALGAQAVKLNPSDDLAFVMDLAGRLNKQSRREERRYLLTPEQGAELITEIVMASKRNPEMAERLDAELARCAERLGAEVGG